MENKRSFSESSQQREASFQDLPFEERLKELGYKDCEKHTNFSYPLVDLCVKKDCPDVLKLACTECRCEHDKHVPHSNQDFQNYMKVINSIFAFTKKPIENTLFNQDLQPLLEKVNALSNEILNLSDRLRAVAVNLIQQISGFIGTEGDYTASQVRKQSELLFLQKSVSTLKTRDEIERYVREITDQVHISIERAQIIVKYKDALNEKKASEDLIEWKKGYTVASVAQIEQKIKTIIANAQQILKVDFEDIQRPKIIRDAKFSNDYHHMGISLDADGLEARCAQKAGNLYHLALFDRELDTFEDQKWAIKIHKIDNRVGVGVCYQTLIKQQNFQIAHNREGCNVYLNWNCGEKWLHVQQAQGAEDQSQLTFVAGETVYLMLSRRRKCLFLSKGHAGQYVKVPIASLFEDLCPCVSFSGETVVSVVQDFDFEFTF